MSVYDAAVLAQMRSWLADLGFADLTPQDVADPVLVPDDDVVIAVDRLYAGGLRAFVATCTTDAREVVR